MLLPQKSSPFCNLTTAPILNLGSRLNLFKSWALLATTSTSLTRYESADQPILSTVVQPGVRTPVSSFLIRTEDTNSLMRIWIASGPRLHPHRPYLIYNKLNPLLSAVAYLCVFNNTYCQAHHDVPRQTLRRLAPRNHGMGRNRCLPPILGERHHCSWNSIPRTTCPKFSSS
jgi:hypothetical protein